MGKLECKLTVYFEEPFWIGVFEHIENGKLTASKVTFGTEPKDYEVQEFILKNYFSLQFSPAVDTVIKNTMKSSKKKMRDAKKMQEKGIGTKSQQALKLQYEQNKQERKLKSRQDRMGREKRLFEMKQQKKKEKHRGR